MTFSPAIFSSSFFYWQLFSPVNSFTIPPKRFLACHRHLLVTLTHPPCSAIHFAIFSVMMNRTTKPTMLEKNPRMPRWMTVTAMRYPKHNRVTIRPQLMLPSRNNLQTTYATSNTQHNPINLISLINKYCVVLCVRHKNALSTGSNFILFSYGIFVQFSLNTFVFDSPDGQ